MVRDIHLTITIPSTTLRQEKYKKVVLYAVLVQCTLASGSQSAWQVFVRYNEFAELFQLLKNRSEDLEKFNFPPKRVLNGDQTVEDRRTQFERFLRLAVLLVPLPVELFLFLELDANTPLNRVKYNVDATRSQSNDSGLPAIRPSVHEFVSDDRSLILAANNAYSSNRRNSDPERIAVTPAQSSTVSSTIANTNHTHPVTIEKHTHTNAYVHPTHLHHVHPHRKSAMHKHPETPEIQVQPLPDSILKPMKILFIITIVLASYRILRLLCSIDRNSPSKFMLYDYV